MSNWNSKYIIARSNSGTILGFAGILINLDYAEVMNIVVRKRYRKQGIGEQLLGRLIEMTKDAGLDKIHLEVNCTNIPAISLYEKNGFMKVGVRPKYYNNTDDAILMDKNLNEWGEQGVSLLFKNEQLNDCPYCSKKM